MSSAPENTTAFLKNVFSEVPATYERVNHILTLGFDRVWRRRAAEVAAASGGGRWVDMCTGTGEMAVLLSSLAPEGTRIQAVDFSPAMMAEARKKTEARDIEFITADIKALPFPDESVDLITMSFATRNISLSRTVLVESFTEFYRVLKPGGHFVTVETSRPPSSVVRQCFHWYVRLFVKRVGSRFSRSKAGYAYLARTITQFYPADALAKVMGEAGFKQVNFRRLLFGVAAIHQARKV